MKIEIPRRLRRIAKLFWSMSQQDLEKLTEVVQRTGPSLHGTVISDEVSDALGIEETLADDLASLLIGVSIQRSRLSGADRVSDEEFVAALYESFRDIDDVPEAPVSGERSFRATLSVLLTGESSLAISSKASDLMYFDQNLFQSQRVVTDLRPIFSEEEGCEPIGGLVTHTLRIDYFDGGDGRSKCFLARVDRRDLENVRESIDRALEKDVSLSKFAKSTGLELLTSSHDDGENA